MYTWWFPDSHYEPYRADQQISGMPFLFDIDTAVETEAREQMP
jgi:hypothetical protein